MKTLVTLAALFLVILLQYCKKDTITIPACIQQKIDSVKALPKRTPPAEVHLFSFEGRDVYLFNACCGNFVKVIDANCKYICSPSGGPSNFGDSLCTMFFEDAKYIRSVWRDDR